MRVPHDSEILLILKKYVASANCLLNRMVCKAVIKTFNVIAYYPLKRWLGNLVASVLLLFEEYYLFEYNLSVYTTLNNRSKLSYWVEFWRVSSQVNVFVTVLVIISPIALLVCMGVFLETCPSQQECL